MSPYRSSDERERREDERRRPWSRRAHFIARVAIATACVSVIAAVTELPLREGFRWAIALPLISLGLWNVIGLITLCGPAPEKVGKKWLVYWSSPLDDEGSIE